MKIKDIEVGLNQPLILIAGPCVIESQELAFSTAEQLKIITDKLKIPFIYKSSFDKANRTSIDSPRGVGIEQGLNILAQLKSEFGLKLITDVHEDTPLDEVADVVDVLQTPAFLCRQTNFIVNVAKTQKPVNIKKGQFLAPEDMQHVVTKAQSTGNNNIMVCERGASFGYHNLVSDMRSLEIMRATNCPVIFDATHSVQQPSAGAGKSSGKRKFVPVLARAACAVGIAGIFMETHPDPDNSWSDAANSFPLDKMQQMLQILIEIDQMVKEQHGFLENEIENLK